MREPTVVMVVSPDDDVRDRLVEAVGRAGHLVFGVRTLEEARSRRGRREAELTIFDRDGWARGGTEYATPTGPRIMMLADEQVLRRRDAYADAGVEEMVGTPVSDLEIFLAVDELLARERTERTASATITTSACTCPTALS